jgi:hypothetical protein
VSPLSPASSGSGSSSGAGSNPDSISLTGQALVGETLDRALATNPALPASGDLRGGTMALRAGQTVTNLVVAVTVAGVGMTHGSLALWDLAGNLLRSTADVPATFNGAGLLVIALSAPFTQPADGLVYATFFGTTGTSMPNVSASPSGNVFTIAALAGGVRRSVKQTGLAAQPNPAVFVDGVPTFWVGAT